MSDYMNFDSEEDMTLACSDAQSSIRMGLRSDMKR